VRARTIHNDEKVNLFDIRQWCLWRDGLILDHLTILFLHGNICITHVVVIDKLYHMLISSNYGPQLANLKTKFGDKINFINNQVLILKKFKR